MNLKEEFDKAKAFFEKEKFVIEDQNLMTVLQCKRLGYPLLLVGPTGCGKTLFLSLLADFYGGHYNYKSLNGSVTIEDLTQERVLTKDGKFAERDLILAHWLRQADKDFSICHLDEVNAARGETLLALHPIMDLKGELDLHFSGEKLNVGKNAFLVMSANEGDEYQGINAMNMAFQNRYIKIHLKYLQGDVLAQLLTDKTGVPFKDTTLVVNTWEKYMNSREPEQPIVSIRLLERWCEMSKEMGLRSAGVAAFANMVAKDDDELQEIIHGDMFVNLPDKLERC